MHFGLTPMIRPAARGAHRIALVRLDGTVQQVSKVYETETLADAALAAGKVRYCRAGPDGRPAPRNDRRRASQLSAPTSKGDGPDSAPGQPSPAPDQDRPPGVSSGGEDSRE